MKEWYASIKMRPPTRTIHQPTCGWRTSRADEGLEEERELAAIPA